LSAVAELDVLKLDVFTDDLYTGNPAWVVMGADGLDEVLMQRAASELGGPETAFVLKSKKADVRLRYFAGDVEEPISGHCTVGALWALAEKNAFGSVLGGRHRVETPVGVLPFSVDMGPDGRRIVWMTQKRPLYSRVEEIAEIASALGIGGESIFHKEFPLSKVSTGLPTLLVSMRSMDALERVSPREDELLQIFREFEVGAVVAYTWGGFDESSTLHTRCFLPVPTFHEDPASGMAAGALAAYLVEHDLIPKDRAENMVIEQGHFIGRPSRVHVRIEKRGSSVRKVEVGGSARISVRGSISLP
jgi:trans-2,3-dihydro-3-hydroxyanthranilate isomerase